MLQFEFLIFHTNMRLLYGILRSAEECLNKDYVEGCHNTTRQENDILPEQHKYGGKML